MHPDTRLDVVDSTVGMGVFATRALPAGTIVWARDPWDRVILPQEVTEDRRKAIETYSYLEADGTRLLIWDHGRFVNHHCEANCIGIDAGFDLVVRDIEAGGEITNDYGVLGEMPRFECSCGSIRCRGTIGLARIEPPTEARFHAALGLVDKVPQPLLEHAQTWLEASLVKRRLARKSA